MATRVVFNRRESALVEQRQEFRHRVECIRVTARGDEEEPFLAVLEDISSFGCRLSGSAPLEVGSRLWLRLPGAPPVVSTIAWSEADEAGCRFATPIGQTLMRSLLPGAV